MIRSTQDKIFDAVNTVLMLFIIIVTIYPFLHILAVSFNDAMDSAAGGITFWPRIWSLDNYATVFKYKGIIDAFYVSIARTVIGTVGSLFITSMAAFAMTKKRLIGYNFLYRFFIIAMFLSCGLIPTFFLYQRLNIYNTFAVYILPSLMGVFNLILFRSFFIQLPPALEESAELDGANELQVFFMVVLPLSLPIFATVGLFVAVYQWNSWQDTLFYTTRPELETLQYVLMKIMRQSEAASMARAAKMGLSFKRRLNITPESIRMAITIVATVPILCVYPFVQKYFVKGIMVGAVKG